eukprot:11154585-Lingulodinium_polyedra.AAC.1
MGPSATSTSPGTSTWDARRGIDERCQLATAGVRGARRRSRGGQRRFLPPLQMCREGRRAESAGVCKARP